MRKPDARRVAGQLVQLLGGKLIAGERLAGALRVPGLIDDLEVVINVEIRRSTPQEKTADWLTELLDGIETGVVGNYATCAEYVKARGGWIPSTRGCHSPVSHAIVFPHSKPEWRFRFVCSKHAARELELPVVAIPKERMKAAVNARQAYAAEARRLSTMTEEERIAEDARISGRIAEAEAIKASSSD